MAACGCAELHAKSWQWNKNEGGDFDDATGWKFLEANQWIATNAPPMGGAGDWHQWNYLTPGKYTVTFSRDIVPPDGSDLMTAISLRTSSTTEFTDLTVDLQGHTVHAHRMSVGGPNIAPANPGDGIPDAMVKVRITNGKMIVPGIQYKDGNVTRYWAMGIGINNGTREPGMLEVAGPGTEVSTVSLSYMGGTENVRSRFSVLDGAKFTAGDLNTYSYRGWCDTVASGAGSEFVLENGGLPSGACTSNEFSRGAGFSFTHFGVGSNSLVRFDKAVQMKPLTQDCDIGIDGRLEICDMKFATAKGVKATGARASADFRNVEFESGTQGKIEKILANGAHSGMSIDNTVLTNLSGIMLGGSGWGTWDYASNTVLRIKGAKTEIDSETLWAYNGSKILFEIPPAGFEKTPLTVRGTQYTECWRGCDNPEFPSLKNHIEIRVDDFCRSSPKGSQTLMRWLNTFAGQNSNAPGRVYNTPNILTNEVYIVRGHRRKRASEIPAGKLDPYFGRVEVVNLTNQLGNNRLTYYAPPHNGFVMVVR